MSKFLNIVHEYVSQAESLLQDFQNDLTFHDGEAKLEQAFEIAKSIDSDKYYWKEFETWLTTGGSIKLLLVWYDMLFAEMGKTFLCSRRIDLMLDNCTTDTIRMIHDRYELNNWDYKADLIARSDEDVKSQ
jgi:hypothetical protein